MTQDTHLSLSVTLTPELRLEQALGQALKKAGIKNPTYLTKLTIAGTMTDGDFLIIGKRMGSTLLELDLGDAMVVKNKIPGWSFYVRSGLLSITIPKSVHEFGDGAFSYLYALQSITVHPDNPVFSSENGLLLNKEKTILIRVPAGLEGEFIVRDTIKKIGTKAFYFCNEVNSIILPDSVTEIDDLAFSECKNLESVFIPKSVTSIGEDIFYGCYKVPSIEIDPDNPLFGSKNNTLFCKESLSFSIHLTPELRLKQAIKDAGIRYPSSIKQLTITGTITSEDLDFIHEQIAITLQELDMGAAIV